MQQLTTKTSPSFLALSRLLGAHAALTRELSTELVKSHGLTLSEHEVLFLLARADDRRMRRIDLAREVRLSPSGLTRLLDRLEGSGLVEKASCATDARVSYAVLTDAGQARLEASMPDHLSSVDRLLAERFDAGELEALAELLGRVSDPEVEEACDAVAAMGAAEPAAT
jgi:DNA-binding MarR family transcriptional regulator